MISTVTSVEPAAEPTAARELAPWPSARSRRTAIVAQFGGARADLAQWALTTADPMADAVAAAIHAEGAAVRAAFGKGVTSGLASVADPHPAVAALLAGTESRPDLHEALSIPTGLGAKALSTLARRFHGETLSDDLGLPHSATAAAALNEAIHAVRARRRKLRRNPIKWEAARERNLGEARKRLAAIADAPEYAGREPGAGPPR